MNKDAEIDSHETDSENRDDDISTWLHENKNKSREHDRRI